MTRHDGRDRRLSRRILRRLVIALVRGRDADFIRADLEEIYERDLNRVTRWRAGARFLRLLIASAWHASLGRRVPGIIPAEPTRCGGGSFVLQDFRFTLRLFGKHPLSIGIAVGGLSIAIAAAASVFTLVNATLLRPYGVDDPSSLYSVGRATERRLSHWPMATFTTMRESVTLSRVEGSISGTVRVSTSSTGDDASRRVFFVSGRYMQMLGARPLAGRSLDDADATEGAEPVAVVSAHFWSTMLDADPAALGKPIWLNGVPVTVVGVMQAEFTGPSDFDVRPAIWAPFPAYAPVMGGGRPQSIASVEVETFARPASAVSVFAARDELDAVVRRARQSSSRPVSPAPIVGLFPAGSPIDRDAADSYAAIGVFFGIAALVLAVACANTSNLLFAAATTRQREMGVRLAMGAGVGRLVRQLLNESLLLAVVAGGVGFPLTFWLVPLLGGLLELPPELRIVPDVRALLVTTFIAVACGLFAGLWPARQMAHRQVLPALRSEGAQGGSMRSRLRSSFIGLQAGVSMFLLVASALLVRSSISMTSTNVGFDVDRLVAIMLPEHRSAAENETYLQAVAAAVRSVPLVEAVSISQYQPYTWLVWRDRVVHDGRSYQINVNQTDAAYFTTAGMTFVRGRGFTADEVAAEAPVAVITESVARGFFDDVDPLGQSIAAVPGEAGETRAPATIIGVLAEAVTAPLYDQISGGIYHPLPRERKRPGGLLVRTATPERILVSLQTAVGAVDPKAQAQILVVRNRLDAFLAGKRKIAWLSAPTAILSLILAGLGLFGVTAFVIGRRMPEVGVRLALGASSFEVGRLLLRDSLRPVLIGVAAGLVLSLGAGQLMANEFLSGISPRDPLAIAVAAATMTIAAVAAVVGPVRRASKVSPASLLRQT